MGAKKTKEKVITKPNSRKEPMKNRIVPDEAITPAMDGMIRVANNQIANLGSRVQTMVVRDEASMKEAAQIVLSLDQLKNKVTEFWKPLKSSAHKTWMDICTREKEMLVKPAQYRNALVGKIDAFTTEQENIRRIEQDRLNAEHQAALRKEESKIDAKIEKARAVGNSEKIAELEDAKSQIDRTPEIIPAMDRTLATDGGSVSRRDELEVIMQSEIEFIMELLNRKEYNVLRSCLDFKMSPIKQYVKLHKITNFPGLTIREIQKSTFRGERASI